MADKTNDVLGLGNMLMDFLVEVEDDKLLEFDLQKGQFHLKDEHEARELLQKIEEYKLEVEIVPGGSVANTLRAIGLLGGNVMLCGKVGKDNHGEMYVQAIENHGVNSRINNHDSVTGHALTFITPDSERTFSVHLGAAVQLFKEDILEEDIAKSKVLHLESYQFEGQTREVVLHAIHLAKKHGTKISLDLSDGGVIRRNKEMLRMIVENYIDIIFANEIEAEDYTGYREQEAAEFLGQYCEIAFVKVGAEGSYLAHQGQVIKIMPFSAEPIDTTGAGDTFSAGFLYGYCNNWPLTKAGKLGSLMASKIIEKKGVRLDQIDIQTLKQQVHGVQHG